mgnify:CR=1 FL=1|tara:strand:- start:38 stop:298 length:261 start_codon:yes stop_codon:yes gene_type:complete
MDGLGKTYVYEVGTMSKAIEIINDYLDKLGVGLGSGIQYSVEDFSDDVERITLGVKLKVTPPVLKTRKDLERVVPSLKDATCLWCE